GSGTTSTTPAAPGPVVGLGPATGIATGTFHACALVAHGVDCWGDNEFGQLGSGSNAGSNTPTPALVDGGATAVAGGYEHTCALMAGGAVECWGRNNFGQLGDGTLLGSPVPVRVP